jgi:hypothetical protein
MLFFSASGIHASELFILMVLYPLRSFIGIAFISYSYMVGTMWKLNKVTLSACVGNA